jgi:hypothetical protein
MPFSKHPHASDGIRLIGGQGAGPDWLFTIGPVQLYFSRDDFYRFAVLVLDAEPAFRSRYCQHGRRISDSQCQSLNEIAGFGQVYECDRCHYIHVDACAQRVVAAPVCFPYFLALLRVCVAQVESHYLDAASTPQRFAGGSH